jgi:hypothetical protein
MKAPVHFLISATAALFLAACDPPAEPGVKADAAVSSDVPLLPVTKGDIWVYDVHLQIPADVTSPGAAELDQNYRRTRTYLGKISPVDGLPEVDCFEVVAPVSPPEREFVEIHPDRILMRGSMSMRSEAARPMWLDHPVPFVVAGMKPGTETPQVQAAGGSLFRKTQVVAREDVSVPAGTFPSIRLLMTGMDGDLELRRTIWFSPGTGIVREEKARYRKGKLIYRETHQLASTSVARQN